MGMLYKNIHEYHITFHLFCIWHKKQALFCLQDVIYSDIGLLVKFIMKQYLLTYLD